MISFIEGADNPMWHGVILAVAMFLASESSSLFLNHYYYLMYRVGTRVQSVLTTAVYRKVCCLMAANWTGTRTNQVKLGFQTLRLANSARREKTVGEIVNLMAIDVDRFQQITPQTQQYWSTPLQACTIFPKV